MNNVMVLVAKSKMSLDSETIVLTALVPEDVEFLYSMLDNYSHLMNEYDLMLQHYCGGSLEAIEKYDDKIKDFRRWIDISSGTECELN